MRIVFLVVLWLVRRFQLTVIVIILLLIIYVLKKEVNVTSRSVCFVQLDAIF